ncbi:MAG: acyl-CoA dehydrogenase C-terminal domain-containing protein [Rhizobiales bacterium]|nr:acyl-CoA dehydrogenase C-terminal domain-containing protein [Hyphomicrobiales bacterium]NRB14408.1 acyl-CoA dehydrogenase C-terminal domain-containing protein [Hyphomicrobiales bacterium]
MPVYNAPLDDSLFVLFDLLQIDGDQYGEIFADIDRETVTAIAGEFGKLMTDVVAPLNITGDKQGCSLSNGVVSTPDGFKAGFEALKAGGWTGLVCDPEYGGQGLPLAMGNILSEYLNSANMGFSMYYGLTMGAYAAIHTCASAELKAKYLPKMVACEWTGTMNLTEPHCGTDLGLIRTKAVDNKDGSFAISGTKIFISAGDHDLAENVIHLVLARSDDMPDGVKGLSLFLVPKINVEADGSLGTGNHVSVGSIEEKMGIHGNSTCVMNFDGSQGYLIGEKGNGLKNMFIMMNEARLGVGIQGLAISEVAFQNARAYALDRRQGKAATGQKDQGEAADRIIHHANIKSSLMSIRAFNEAARALVGEVSVLTDVIHKTTDEKVKSLATDRVNLLTPIVKGVMTDQGFDNAVVAQQIFGGHGYIQEHGMEQFVRDARIAMIYEGTNDIQALDLVSRKLPAKHGQTVMAYLQDIGGFIEANKANKQLADIVSALQQASEALQVALGYLMEHGQRNPDNAVAAAHDFMHLMGIVTFGHIWAKMALVAHEKLADDSKRHASEDFYKSKIYLANHYAAKHLPQAKALQVRLCAGAASVNAMPIELI